MKKVITGILLGLTIMVSSAANAEVFQCSSVALPQSLSDIHSGKSSQAGETKEMTVTVVEAYDRTTLSAQSGEKILNFPAMQQEGDSYYTASGNLILSRYTTNGEFGYTFLSASKPFAEADTKDIISLVYIQGCKSIGQAL